MASVQMVDKQFNGHSMFQKVLKEAFESFVNKVRARGCGCYLLG